MQLRRLIHCGAPAIVLALASLPAGAQSFRVQCPETTTLRPRQNRVDGTHSLYDALKAANDANRARVADANAATAGSCSDILCTGATPLPAINTHKTGGAKYAYNDGNGSTQYDVEVPIQIMGFDPNFHFVGMTFNPEAFADMKDKYFLLNGRSYPPIADAAGIYVSGLMADLERAPLPPAWRGTARMSYPFDLPTARKFRMNYPLGWLQVRHIAPADEIVQSNTYLACGILAELLTSMQDNFVRDYLIERIEDMLSHRVLSGLYPRLGLAPGQRFASKGGYIVHFTESAGTQISPDTDWMVP
jgi:hypothetical protein